MLHRRIRAARHARYLFFCGTMLPCAACQASMSSRRQAVTPREILSGAGNAPAFTLRHRVAAENGRDGKMSFRRRNGASCRRAQLARSPRGCGPREVLRQRKLYLRRPFNEGAHLDEAALGIRRQAEAVHAAELGELTGNQQTITKQADRRTTGDLLDRRHLKGNGAWVEERRQSDPLPKLRYRHLGPDLKSPRPSEADSKGRTCAGRRAPPQRVIRRGVDEPTLLELIEVSALESPVLRRR